MFPRKKPFTSDNSKKIDFWARSLARWSARLITVRSCVRIAAGPPQSNNLNYNHSNSTISFRELSSFRQTHYSSSVRARSLAWWSARLITVRSCVRIAAGPSYFFISLLFKSLFSSPYFSLAVIFLRSQFRIKYYISVDWEP